MKKLYLVKEVSKRAFIGFLVGVTILMILYVSIYFVAGNEVFENEILQFQNIEILIKQILYTGVSWAIIYSILYINLILEDSRVNNWYKVFSIIISLFALIIYICISSNANIYTENIADMNIIISISIFILLIFYSLVKKTIEKVTVKKINKKIHSN